MFGQLFNQLTAEELFILLSAWVVLDFVFLPREHVTISRSVSWLRCRFRLYKFMIIALYTTLKDKSSAWSNFMLRFLKRFIAHTVNIIILRQRNLSKHCLLGFLCLSIEIPSSHVSENTSKVTAKNLDHGFYFFKK